MGLAKHLPVLVLLTGATIAACGTESDETGSDTTSTSTTGTSTQTSTCDGVGSCIDDCFGCATAAGGPCAEEAEACNATADCLDYRSCASLCSSTDTACLAECETDHPDGPALLDAFNYCFVCEACFVTCDGANAEACS